MQRSYINALYKLMKEDKNVISCLSDSGTDYDEMIKREMPNQVINFGISENNKVAAASGLAKCGKIPFVYTTNAFLAYRSYEFIRDDVCLQNQNVKLIGMGAGLSWSTLGSTHHTTEDIAVLKVLPNLTLLSPCSPKELESALKCAYEIKGPVYIRMGMSGEKEIYDSDVPFVLGKNNTVKEGTDGVIFVTGSIIAKVLEACDKLTSEEINLKVVNISTIKPFDVNSVVENSVLPIMFSVEEHSIVGGIGSSIADALVDNNINTKLVRIGLNDTFAKGYGTHDEILKMNGLDSESIYNKIKKELLK